MIPLRKLLVIGILVLGMFTQASASDILSQQIRADGSPVNITLSPSDTWIKTIRLWFVSKGAMTVPLELGLNGPDNVKISAKYKLLGNLDPATTVNEMAGWLDMSFKANHAGKEKPLFRIKNSNATTAMAAADGCAGFSEDYIEQVRRVLSEEAGRTVTREEVCALLETEGTEPPPANPVALQLTGLIHKNTCAADADSKYLVRVDLDLSEVSPALLQTGYAMQMIPYLVKYKDRVAGKIKVGDDNGMYAGRWILLIAQIQKNKDRINAVKWKGNKIKSTTNIRIGNFGKYRNFPATRSQIGALLKGGKATIEVTNGYQALSICFAMKKKVQEVNWPKPGS